MGAGPIVIAYDGSPASEQAVRDAAPHVAERRALVVVVWKAGIGLEAVLPDALNADLPPARLDVRTADEVDREMAERAQALAQNGASLAREAGFEADGLAVADDVDTPLAETLTDVAAERDARAVVVGTHDHGGILGPITRDVIRRARCPVLVRGPAAAASPPRAVA
jgi:nucleotide-binding universal stress UspA family protein